MGFKANDRQLNRMNGMSGRFRGGLNQSSNMAGQMLVRTTQQGMAHGSKSGRMYGSHQASAPGEYSAPRTWSLHNSVRYEVSADTLRFGVGTHYGGFHEFGTSKMAPRPNLKQSYDENKGDLENVFGARLFRIVMGNG